MSNNPLAAEASLERVRASHREHHPNSVGKTWQFFRLSWSTPLGKQPSHIFVPVSVSIKSEDSLPPKHPPQKKNMLELYVLGEFVVDLWGWFLRCFHATLAISDGSRCGSQPRLRDQVFAPLLQRLSSNHLRGNLEGVVQKLSAGFIYLKMPNHIGKEIIQIINICRVE